MAAASRTMSIAVAGQGRSFKVTYQRGVDPQELLEAVQKQLGSADEKFHFTLQSDESMIVPLSPALPDGAELVLHLSSTAIEAMKKSTSGQLRLSGGSNDTPPQMDPDEIPMRRMLSSPRGLACVTPFGSAIQSKWRREKVSTGDVAVALTSVERFSRWSADLANERTALAWMRTAMAGQRTIFKIAPLVGTTYAMDCMVDVARYAMVYLIIILSLFGCMRFLKMRRIISMKNPTTRWFRTTTWPVYPGVLVFAFAVAVGAASQSWHNHPKL